MTASPQPTKCLLRIYNFISQRENIRVVTILAPLSIMKVEPDIRAKAVHCNITENKSDKAGIMNIFVENVLMFCFLR